MARLREVGKYGNSFVIKLIPEDIQDLELELGDKLDIEDAMIVKKRKQK
jgi:hypothetical protein